MQCGFSVYKIEDFLFHVLKNETRGTIKFLNITYN